MFGLTICNQIVKKYNGKLFLKSKINKGSTFGFDMDMKLFENKIYAGKSIN